MKLVIQSRTALARGLVCRDFAVEPVEEPQEVKDLRIDLETVRSWFEDDDTAEAGGVLVVRVPDTAVAGWWPVLTEAVRRCYASDEAVLARTASGLSTQAEYLRAVLPDPGSVMSGDFGEVLTFLFLGTQTVADAVVGPKKWRLKQDRRKAAPHSDVVQFVVPQWPASSGDDRLNCAEVKSKATINSSTPIKSAIEDSAKDRLGRLARTLAWLDERAVLGEDFGDSTPRDLIQRFLHPSDHPAAEKRYWAVAVVCSSLVGAELAGAPSTPPDECSLLVISVPELKQQYETVYEAVIASAIEASST